MKTFNRTYLPESINYNGKTYARYQPESDDYIVIKVLSRQLKGKTDLYGLPYKPTSHKLYVEEKYYCKLHSFLDGEKNCPDCKA